MRNINSYITDRVHLDIRIVIRSNIWNIAYIDQYHKIIFNIFNILTNNIDPINTRIL